MFQKLPCNRGHTAHRRNLLALYDRQGLSGIPLVHRDNLVTAQHGRDQDRERTGCMEERNGQQRRLLLVWIRFRNGFAPTQQHARLTS